MERGVGSIWCLVLLILGVLPGCWSQGSHTVIIDGYRHNSPLTSGDSVPLGTQIILVCRVVGLPYGTPLSYTWTCPNGSCEIEGYYGRKVYNEHILAVNTTSTSDGGPYTCQVTATGGQEATGNFTLTVTGGRVVHSYGRLIPHEFPITDLQQISGPDGIGRITCTVSSGTAGFVVNGGQLETGGVSQTRNGSTATLVVNPSNDVAGFQNRGLYCPNIEGSYFYLFLSSTTPLSVPSLMVNRVTNSAVEYQVKRNDDVTNADVNGYEVTRFGVPMIGEYENKGRVTISRAVPGAQYRITAWAVGDRRRSVTPAVVDATTGEASPSSPRSPSITRKFQNGTELNWLPPTKPNGEVHYVIYYTPDGGTEQSIDTGSDLTHYNLTGLERNRVYTNIAVQAVNSAGRSGRSAVIAQYNHTPSGSPAPSGSTPDLNSTTDDASGGSSAPPASNTTDATVAGFTQPTDKPNTTAAVAGVVVAILVAVLLALVGGMVAVVVVVKKRKMKKTGQPHSQAYLQDSVQAKEGHKDNINMYQNVQMKPTPTPGNSEPYYSTVADDFANPASATATFGANTYDEGGLYEDAGVDASRGGGGCKDKPVKGASGVQTASALLARKGYELMHPEDLYAQPDKAAKVKKKDNQGSTIEETPAPVEDLYAMPDMTEKMKQKNQKSLKQDSEERKLPPQAPLPYKKHKEAKEEGEEDVPELPPPYDFDGEQDCDTGDGDGSERRFEYAVLDWQKK